MANTNRPFGFKVNIPLAPPTEYPIDPSAALMFIGDAVTAVADAGVTTAAAGNTIKGICASIRNSDGLPCKNYPGGNATGYFASVYDQPGQQFIAQCNTALTAEDINEFADLVADTDGNPTGLSGQYLGAFATTGATFKLIGLDKTNDNAWGAYQKVIVIINEHADRAVDATV